MRIGIISADIDEITPILSEMETSRTVEKAMLKYHEGTLCGQNIVALYCGACKVNAAVGTQILIDDFDVDAVLNIGVAGGMDPKVKVFDAVISTEVAYHDIQPGVLTGFHPWMKSEWFAADEKLLNVARSMAGKIKTPGKIFFGRMVTGDIFIEDDGRDTIMEKFAPLSVDMETGSMAHVCYVNKVPFLSIRTITDTAEYSGSANYEENLMQAVEIVKDLTKAFLCELADGSGNVADEPKEGIEDKRGEQDFEVSYSLTPEEYMALRKIVGWHEFPLEEAAAGLKVTSFLYCLRKDGKPIALGRAVWDHGYVVYIADVIVVPEYQGQGLGRRVMNYLMERINGIVKPGYLVMVSLMAAKGKEEFYKKFGFVERPSERFGCGMHQWIERPASEGNAESASEQATSEEV